MKFPENEKEFEEVMKGIKWNRIIPPLVSVLQPVILFGLWLGFTKIDKRADAVAKLIALAEPLPFDIDLNVPQPVVLASLYHSVDEALDVLKEIIEYLKDLDVPSADEIIDGIKDDLVPDIIPVEETAALLKALADCRANAKKNLGVLYPVTGPMWIWSCMNRKGFSITVDYVKDKFF